MKALIIEDEDLAVRKLRKLVAEVDPDLKIQAVTASIEDSVNWLKKNDPPDLIFMDIELADGQSFEIFNQVEIKSRVIFITSYDEYVLPAFRNNSVDYLLKPILKEDLLQSLSKLRNQAQINESQSLTDQEPVDIKKFLGELQAAGYTGDYKSSLLAKQEQKLFSVEVDDVMYFYTDGQLTSLRTRDGQKLQSGYTIDELDRALDPRQFYRIHNMILSHRAVERFKAYPGNRVALMLTPSYSKEVVLSQEEVVNFKIWMNR